MSTYREELAWAAGFYDGEGSCGCYVNRNRWCRLVVSVSQNDTGQLERFQRAVGGLGKVRCAGGKSRPQLHVWRPDTFQEGQAVIAMLWTFMGQPKREQAARALSQMKELRKVLTKNPYTPKVRRK